jgi:hypothetical protein
MGDELDSTSITVKMHSCGVNIRYLGKVAERCELPHVREALVVEMLARTSKKVLCTI